MTASGRSEKRCRRIALPWTPLAGVPSDHEATVSAPATPGLTHSMPLRVYYEDTDAAGIVYYANYLKFAERGRTEMMRALGFAHSGIAAETGIVFTVRRLTADYRQPARLDDLLSVETRIVEIGGATLLLDQRICRDGAVLVALDVLVACVGAGRPAAPGAAGAARRARRAVCLRAAINRPKDAIKGRQQCNRYKPQHLPAPCPRTFRSSTCSCNRTASSSSSC